MLQPKRTKFRKQFRGKMRGIATTGSSVSFGEIGLKAMAASWITARQIEAARVAVTRHLKRGGQVWVRVFPDKSVSKKADRKTSAYPKLPLQQECSEYFGLVRSLSSMRLL